MSIVYIGKGCKGVWEIHLQYPIGRFFAHIPPHSIDIKWLLHISSYIYRSSISIVNIDISAPDSQLHLLRLQMLKLCWILASANLEIPTQKVHVSWPVDRPGAALVWLLGGNSFLYFVSCFKQWFFTPNFWNLQFCAPSFLWGRKSLGNMNMILYYCIPFIWLTPRLRLLP